MAEQPQVLFPDEFGFYVDFLRDGGFAISDYGWQEHIALHLNPAILLGLGIPVFDYGAIKASHRNPAIIFNGYEDFLSDEEISLCIESKDCLEIRAKTLEEFKHSFTLPPPSVDEYKRRHALLLREAEHRLGAYIDWDKVVARFPTARHVEIRQGDILDKEFNYAVAECLASYAVPPTEESLGRRGVVLYNILHSPNDVIAKCAEILNAPPKSVNACRKKLKTDFNWYIDQFANSNVQVMAPEVRALLPRNLKRVA
jgi:hypothetical protein